MNNVLTFSLSAIWVDPVRPNGGPVPVWSDIPNAASRTNERLILRSVDHRLEIGGRIGRRPGAIVVTVEPAVTALLAAELEERIGGERRADGTVEPCAI